MSPSPKLTRTELLHRVRDAVQSGDYRVLPHARQRCTERDVSVPDIEHVLENGHVVPRRDRRDERGWTYCFEGTTIDSHEVRIVVAFEDRMLVVTVVRLDLDVE